MKCNEGSRGEGGGGTGQVKGRGGADLCVRVLSICFLMTQNYFMLFLGYWFQPINKAKMNAISTLSNFVAELSFCTT